MTHFLTSVLRTHLISLHWSDLHTQYTSDHPLCVLPFQVNDAPALRLLRVSPRAVGLELEAAFAEMTFLHGYIHADPHPGNIMVRTKGRWLLMVAKQLYVLGCVGEKRVEMRAGKGRRSTGDVE
jgi:hypothetical protein